MKLNTATKILMVGSLIFLLGIFYNSFFSLGIIELNVGNYQVHNFLLSLANGIFAVTVLIFSVSFLKAQNKRGK
ncbi:Uncharacterised protein [Paenibacillus macerans]|nr:hypothetical protein PbDSM24746_33410 [Paenibacillus macerans]GBK69650.1 hypothetical protein PbJCM17693_33580 [Paenibacillus macerans]GIP07924.1 hypothetical protein J1TS5_00940 [Paenibacillus macerans]SUA82764.1 Uncharacterised protein [Paenibacillus macerans]